MNRKRNKTEGCSKYKTNIRVCINKKYPFFKKFRLIIYIASHHIFFLLPFVRGFQCFIYKLISYKLIVHFKCAEKKTKNALVFSYFFPCHKDVFLYLHIKLMNCHFQL